MFAKKLVLELWFKNLWTKQNAGFFKLQCLKKQFRYDVEFLYMTRHS